MKASGLIYLLLTVCEIALLSCGDSGDLGGPLVDDTYAFNIAAKITPTVLSDIARDLGSDRSWLADGLAVSSIRDNDFVALGSVAESLASRSTIQDTEGREFEVRIELMRPYERIDSSARYGLIVDPDKFDEATDLTVYWSDSTVGQFPLPDESQRAERAALADSFEDPVFVVTVEEVEDPIETERVRKEQLKLLSHSSSLHDPFSESAAGANGQYASSKPLGHIPPEYYLTLHALTLREDNDPFTNEEFELYLGASNNIELNTYHMFNGNSRYDAANNWRTYPDINKKSTVYMSADIALVRGIVKCCGWQESASGDFRLPLSFHRR